MYSGKIEAFEGVITITFMSCEGLCNMSKSVLERTYDLHECAYCGGSYDGRFVS